MPFIYPTDKILETPLAVPQVRSSEASAGTEEKGEAGKSGEQKEELLEIETLVRAPTTFPVWVFFQARPSQTPLLCCPETLAPAACLPPGPPLPRPALRASPRSLSFSP